MIKTKKNLTGLIFGRLKVIRQDNDYIDKNGKHRAMWLCECSCDNKTLISVRGDSLTNNHTKSCGCLQSENAHKIGKLNQEYNKYSLSGEYGIIWSANTNERIYFDLEYADLLLRYNWYVDPQGYAAASINRKKVKMHILLGYKKYDHHNRNKLDNRKENLVQCTTQENTRNGSLRSTNKSGFIGVSQRKDTKRWEARITIDGRGVHLGYFLNKEDAVKARLQAEAEYFKEFAPQRHLFKQYGIEH